MLVIGEKINGTRREVAKAITDRDRTVIQRLARSQVNNGAHYLDVNAGTHPDREPEDMVWLVQTIMEVVDTPLCLDSANPEALLAGLRTTAKVPMINSISGEQRRLEGVLPIAAEHRTPLILLALNDAGIPKTANERMAIVQGLVDRCRDVGLPDSALYIDPLITTIATDTTSALVTFDTMRQVKAAFPETHLVCGLSNISFGQPQRSLINQVFAALAIASGLDTAIIDPGDKHLMGAILAAEMLLGQDPNCLHFNKALRSGHIGTLNTHSPANGDASLADALKQLVSAMVDAGIMDAAVSGRRAGAGDPHPAPETVEGEAPALSQLVDALVNMREDEVMALAEAHLAAEGDPMALLDASREAMAMVGDLFEKREYFVPELMLAGEMLNQIATIVKPRLAGGKEAQPHKGRVIIGTVEGDIHDIGKDIVVTMLGINGYDVLDLGVDVPAEKFVQAAREFKPRVVGLSGFLTLAYEPMKQTIQALREDHRGDMKYMIGGGQMDSQVARYVGADAFGRDALEAVRLCDQWITDNSGD